MYNRKSPAGRKTFLIISILFMTMRPMLDDSERAMPLHEKTLAQGFWNAAPEHPGHDHKITFKAGKFQWVDAIAEKEAHYSGSYTIEKNALRLSGVKEASVGGSWPVPTEILCFLVPATDALEFEEKLACVNAGGGDFSVNFTNTKVKTKPGAERVVSDMPVIYAPGVKRPTATVVLRSMPDTSADSVTWFMLGKSGAPEARKNLLKGEKIKVLARTQKKMKVGKFNNYWYYVETDGVSEFGGVPLSIRGWAYGQFLK